MNAETLVVNIIRELDKNRMESSEGLSSWDLYKLLKSRIPDISQARIEYYLKKFLNDNLFVKKGSKYKIETPIVINNDGSIIVANPPMILVCPFRDKCNCEDGFNIDCKYFKSMPESLQNFFGFFLNGTKNTENNKIKKEREL